MENRYANITDNNFTEVFNKACRRSDIVKYFNLPDNGASRRFVNNKIKELNLDMNILKENYFNKYHIKKVCPVCGKEFYTSTTEKYRKKICCSCACSNTYFRSGENNGMYDNGGTGKEWYRRLCFKYHPHKCCICGEENIVACHHYDGKHNNNDICNFVPLCPTHHQYWHSRFRNLIQDKVDEYVNNFIKTFKK